MYHRVLSPEELQDEYVQPGMYVSLRTFEKQIAYLKTNYRILFLEDLFEDVNRKENTEGCCAITFDDGWRDNRINAFPILKKYKAPATIFLTTGFVGTGRIFWPEEICSLLQLHPLKRHILHTLSPPVSRFHVELEKNPQNGHDGLLDKAVEVLKGFSPGERNAVLEYYRGLGNPGEVSSQMLSWEDVTEMAKSGLVRFGAHTVGHEILDQVPPEIARSEISQSKEEIEGRLATRVAAFAYPNGNLNRDISEAVKDCGFDCAVTTRKGYLAKDTPPFEVPRIGMHEDVSSTIAMFRSRIIFRNF